MKSIAGIILSWVLLHASVCAGALQLTADGGTGTPGARVLIPVYLSSPDITRGASFTVGYDQRRFSLVNVFGAQPDYLTSYEVAPGVGRIQVSVETFPFSSMMPPFGPALGADGAMDVANFVRSLSGLSSEPDRTARGRDVYSENCAACHGVDAKGTPALTAPDLTDNKWIYGSGAEQIYEVIVKGAFGSFGYVSGALFTFELAVVDPYPVSIPDLSIISISGDAIDGVGHSISLATILPVVSIFPIASEQPLSEGNTSHLALLAVVTLLAISKARSLGLISKNR
jgi:hypothetical protein